MSVLPFHRAFWQPWFAMIKTIANRSLLWLYREQIIQFDDEGQTLFSTVQLGAICENRNLHICVIDIDVCAVVVVNHAGQFRFKYIGPNAESTPEHSFDPVSITTDSQSHILIADYDNHRIHIVDQDGQYQFDIRHPYGLYVDLRKIYMLPSLTEVTWRKFNVCGKLTLKREMLSKWNSVFNLYSPTIVHVVKFINTISKLFLYICVQTIMYNLLIFFYLPYNIKWKKCGINNLSICHIIYICKLSCIPFIHCFHSLQILWKCGKSV